MDDRKSEIVQLLQSNIRRQSAKLRSDVEALTNAADAAKYAELASALSASADLLERVSGRLRAARNDEEQRP